MKIHNDVTQSLSAHDKTTNKPTILPAKAAPATTAVDSVSISDTSRTLLATGTQSTEAPFDAARVAAIKAAISAGHFKVNPEAVADKVLDSASQLLTGRG